MNKANKQNIFLLFTLMIISSTGCTYYHEPAFKGTILDYDTKQPIEGAVVVVEYQKATSFLAPHSTSSIMDVRETLTNKEGNFALSSYTTFMAPIYEQIPSSLIIFRPGYAGLKTRTDYFTGEELREEQEGSWYWAKDLKYRISSRGIVELPKVRTREERRNARMDADISGADVKENTLPLLYKLISEERNNSF